MTKSLNSIEYLLGEIFDFLASFNSPNLVCLTWRTIYSSFAQPVFRLNLKLLSRLCKNARILSFRGVTVWAFIFSQKKQKNSRVFTIIISSFLDFIFVDHSEDFTSQHYYGTFWYFKIWFWFSSSSPFKETKVIRKPNFVGFFL